MNEQERRKHSFLSQLKNLLEEFDASIAVDSDPDSDLISDYNIGVDVWLGDTKILSTSEPFINLSNVYDTSIQEEL
jgi:hypothetical protein